MECQVGGLQKKPCQKITVVDFSATNFEEAYSGVFK